MTKGKESPIISELLEYIKQQGDLIQKLRDEVAELKGQKTKPKIKPSNLENVTAKQKKLRVKNDLDLKKSKNKRT